MTSPRLWTGFLFLLLGLSGTTSSGSQKCPGEVVIAAKNSLVMIKQYAWFRDQLLRACSRPDTSHLCAITAPRLTLEVDVLLDGFNERAAYDESGDDLILLQIILSKFSAAHNSITDFSRELLAEKYLLDALPDEELALAARAWSSGITALRKAVTACVVRRSQKRPNEKVLSRWTEKYESSDYEEGLDMFFPSRTRWLVGLLAIVLVVYGFRAVAGWGVSR